MTYALIFLLRKPLLPPPLPPPPFPFINSPEFTPINLPLPIPILPRESPTQTPLMPLKLHNVLNNHIAAKITCVLQMFTNDCSNEFFSLDGDSFRAVMHTSMDP